MYLWISGFLAGDNEDDSLKYSLTVQPDLEQAIMGVLGWDGLDESPEGEWLLAPEQVREIAVVVNEELPTELDLFIGVRQA